MIKIDKKIPSLEMIISQKFFDRLLMFLEKFTPKIIVILLAAVSTYYFRFYLMNGLGLAYNDARSHLDIGRRVVEGLKPGVAQLGSVWLPLNHILMIPTIWNDWFWHTGLAGTLQNMLSFVATGLVIYYFLKELRVGLIGRCAAVAIFALNLNVIYLQSTAMTEMLLLATMTIGCYELLLWHRSDKITNLIKAAAWIMLATLTRYDGWFLLAWATLLVGFQVFRQNLSFNLSSIKSAYMKTEGTLILFLTLAGLGIIMWFVWNQLIFKDALYFALGPFSAHAQQQQLLHAGVLATKANLLLSIKVYFFALMYNSYTFPAIMALVGAVLLWRDKSLSGATKLATTSLFAPLAFNILALYLGFSVLFVQGIAGDTWFNIRYGIMLLPSIAIFMGYLIDRSKNFRPVILGLTFLVLFFAFASKDAVTIDDARVGSSQKNVSEVSGYLNSHALNETGFVLISAASHDAIIFSSGLPMKRFIHEGTGKYWLNATAIPDHWARWIVMRTYDDNDITWKAVKKTAGLKNYNLVAKYPFADVYELKPEFVKNLKHESVGMNK